MGATLPMPIRYVYIHITKPVDISALLFSRPGSAFPVSWRSASLHYCSFYVSRLEKRCYPCLCCCLYSFVLVSPFLWPPLQAPPAKWSYFMPAAWPCHLPPLKRRLKKISGWTRPDTGGYWDSQILFTLRVRLCFSNRLKKLMPCGRLTICMGDSIYNRAEDFLRPGYFQRTHSEIKFWNGIHYFSEPWILIQWDNYC